MLNFGCNPCRQSVSTLGILSRFFLIFNTCVILFQPLLLVLWPGAVLWPSWAASHRSNYPSQELYLQKSGITDLSNFSGILPVFPNESYWVILLIDGFSKFNSWHFCQVEPRKKASQKRPVESYIPQPGIKPRRMAVKAPSPNHGTTREFPFFFLSFLRKERNPPPLLLLLLHTHKL